MEESVLMTTSMIENDDVATSVLTIENEKIESNENRNSTTDKTQNDDTNSNIEERYNKLRGFAVKLKRKVSDLTEKTHVLESENQRLNDDKEELQNKLLRMSDSAKKLKTIQSQYDKAQDDVEILKNENKRLIKRLENLVLENDSFKDAVVKEKKDVSQLSSKVLCLSEEKSKLEITCEQLEKKVKDLSNEVKAELMVRQQKTKECDDIKNSLEAEIRAHKSTRSRLDDMKHNHTSNNVLSLEVANYEKSIDTIKTKLDEETSERISLEAAVSQHLETIEVLNTRISELQDSCLTKTNYIMTLEEKNQILETDVHEFKLEISKALKEKKSFAQECQCLETSKKDLETKISLLTSEINKVDQENRSCIKAYQSHMDNLKRETSRLNLALENSKQQTCNLEEEFENYKLRAQSVLLKTKNVPCDDLEEEIENCKRQITLLNDKCESYRQKTDSLMKEIILLKDEKSRSIASEEEFVKKLGILKQDSVAIMERYKNKETEFEKLKIHYEDTVHDLRKNFENQIINIRNKYEEDIQNIKLEAIVNCTVLNQSCSSDIPSLITVPTSSPPLIEREECEGSESIEFSQTTKNSEYNHGRIPAQDTPTTALTPLDQLLEFPFDEHEIISKVPEDSPEVVVYKNRVKHLTELLSDAERDIAKLTQLNQLLKEDIRRQKRYVQREKEAVNFEYLKNVVFKFVTLENKDERSRLVPVLDTILKLSPEETHKLEDIVSATGGVANKRSWIPGWSGS